MALFFSSDTSENNYQLTVHDFGISASLSWNTLIINWIKAWFLHNGEHHFSHEKSIVLVFTKGSKSLKIHCWLTKNIMWIFGIIKIKIFSQDKKSPQKR